MLQSCVRDACWRLRAGLPDAAPAGIMIGEIVIIFFGETQYGMEFDVL